MGTPRNSGKVNNNRKQLDKTANKKGTKMLDLKSLFVGIAQTEDGKIVIEKLREAGLMEDKYWRLVGAKKGQVDDFVNATTIENQHADSVEALVDSLLNSADSALMLQCELHDIDPKSSEAPGSLYEAKDAFLGTKGGTWIDFDPKKMGKLGEQFSTLVVTGEKGKQAEGSEATKRDPNPSYAIIDRAEGQKPGDFPTTFMGLALKNKNEIPFVQGKFHAGGFAVANFCTEDVHLIISKRNPALLDDPTKPNLWGATIVRRIDPTTNSRLSDYVYLVIDEKIPSFEADSLPLLPGDYPNPYGRKLKFGTFKKVFNYEVESKFAKNITGNLYKKLNMLLPNPVLPIKLFERRPGFKNEKTEETVSGLESRLHNDEAKVVETKFPWKTSFQVEGQQFQMAVYVYNKYANNSEALIKKDDYGAGVLFSLNGQTNAKLEPSFFHRGGLKFESIKDNMLVILDCSAVEDKFTRMLFRPDRGTFVNRKFKRNVEDKIREKLKYHAPLKEVQHNWHKAAATSSEDSKKDKQKWEDRLEAELKAPHLTALLDKGIYDGPTIMDPFGEGEPKPPFVSNYWPTKFKARKPHPRTNPQNVEKRRNYRFFLESDAPNDYFDRFLNAGNYQVFFGLEEITNNDGVELTHVDDSKWVLHLPKRKEEEQGYTLYINDTSRTEPFEIDFWLKLTPYREHPPTPDPPPPEEEMVELPKLTEVYKDQYHEHGADENDVITVDDKVDGREFFVMMENVVLKASMKGLTEKNIRRSKEDYKIRALKGALSIAKQYDIDKNTDLGLNEVVKKNTRYWGHVLPWEL